MNCQRRLAQPPVGGWRLKATMALMMGAPAKTMAITTLGDPPAPKARRTKNAPAAPTIPARKDHRMPWAGKSQGGAVSNEHEERSQHRCHDVGDSDQQESLVPTPGRDRSSQSDRCAAARRKIPSTVPCSARKPAMDNPAPCVAAMQSAWYLLKSFDIFEELDG